MMKTHEDTIAESMMFLEQPKPHFLPSSRQIEINFARKVTAKVFQRIMLSVIYYEIQITN